MLIGQRLRALREAKNMSQLEISEATRLVQPYVSRVENGHTVPGVETLEKWATALKIPLYQILYDGAEPPKPPKLSSSHDSDLWGDSGRDSHDLKRLRQFLAKMGAREREMLISMAARMASRARKNSSDVEES
jgi:transcriptional regulator with XRE-family HTH domain